MRNNILAMAGITLSITAIAGSVLAIPSHLPEREVKKLGNIDITDLWTSHPVSIEPDKQNFERLPALVVEQPKSSELNSGASDIVASEIQSSRRLIRPDAIYEGKMSIVALSPAYGTDMETAAWCAERYRSYHASDNTYQPYSGARRQCEPPFTASLHSTETADDVHQASDIGQDGFYDDAHAQWCFARYRSYNPDNNTYRAFSGEIRSCVSPSI
jgi:hypothetical protein